MGMRPFSTIAAALLAFALVGCAPKGSGGGSAEGGGGSGGGLLHDIASEMGGAKKATRTGVAFDLYYDVSDSSANLRKPLGKLLEGTADTYPEAVPYTYSFFGKDCDLQGEGVTNVQSLRRADKAWAASTTHDQTTNLAKVFGRIAERAADAPTTDFAAVIVSDGGFEDPDAARGALRKLGTVANLKALVFVGVHTGDNPKLERLTDLVRALKNGDGKSPIEVQLVTDSNNEARIDAAKATLGGLVATGGKAE